MGTTHQKLIGTTFHHFSHGITDPTVRSWLNALFATRERTTAALEHIMPWHAIVKLAREKYHLMIGDPTCVPDIRGNDAG